MKKRRPRRKSTRPTTELEYEPRPTEAASAAKNNEPVVKHSDPLHSAPSVAVVSNTDPQRNAVDPVKYQNFPPGPVRRSR